MKRAKMAAAGAHLVEELETAFQNCLASLVNQEHYSSSEQDEVRTSVEQTNQKFIDLAKQTECFFLQKRMQLSITKPEQFIKEDTTELKQELIRKDELIQKHYEKLAQWQAILNRSQSSPSAGAPQQQVGGPAQQSSMPHPQQQMQQQQQQQPPNMMQQQQQHPPQQMVSHMQQHSAYQPQGPLHYLEQTTSNIGMPERR